MEEEDLEEEDDDDLEEEQDDEEPEDDGDDETEEVKEKETEKLSEDELKKLKQIDQEITRLRDHGVFNAELLYQVIKANDNLERIAKVLEDLAK